MIILLSQELKSDYIQLDLEAENFEDAIRKSLEPLVRDGAVTDLYVKEVINIYHTTGPYIVITKHIALPHAPSAEGAQKLALGFTRLKTAVVSGNKENDPVSFLFPLSAPDNHSHIELLSELADLLSDSAFIDLIQKAKTSGEVIDFLKKYEGENKNV